MWRRLAAAVIRGYQRYLSPYKGFCCAYRRHTGRHSCSEYARRVALRLGPGALWAAMPRQFARCRAAHAVLLANSYDTRDEHRDDEQRERSHGIWNRCDAPCEDLMCYGLHLPCDIPCDSVPCDNLPCDCSPPG